MIKMPKKINFIEPYRRHAPSKWYPDADKKTIYEVAESLEDKYNILNKFTVAHKSDLENILKKNFIIALKKNLTQKEFNDMVRTDFSSVWRAYILNEEHGISTKASRLRDDPSFVDTSDYYFSMDLELIYD